MDIPDIPFLFKDCSYTVFTERKPPAFSQGEKDMN